MLNVLEILPEAELHRFLSPIYKCNSYNEEAKQLNIGVISSQVEETVSQSSHMVLLSFVPILRLKNRLSGCVLVVLVSVDLVEVQ